MSNPNVTPSNLPTFLTDQEKEGVESDEDESIVETYEEVQIRLMEAINTIDKKFLQVIDQHESDFLKSYKLHMESVYKELKALKDQALALEAETMKDDTLLALQKQIKWYKSESIKLIKVYENY